MPSPEKSIRGICPLQRDKSVEEKLGLISVRPNLNMGSAELDENGLLLDHAVSYHPNEKFECACPTVSKIRRDYAIPREYCYCCGGHFRYHYEIMLGVRLRLVEIVTSPHDTCWCMNRCPTTYK